MTGPLGRLAAEIREGARTVSSIAAERLAMIGGGEDALAAFTHVDSDAVLAEAARLDVRLAGGETPGPLAGVPVAVKDVIDVRGLRTGYGSLAFPPYVAERDAHAVARLRAAGALVLGKVRTSEFVWGATTPPTRNPLNPAWVAGGSSGGSGAAVGAGYVEAALGTDTGGSVRIPAAICGTAGYKATFGCVGRTGVLPGNLWFDNVGPLARSVSDLRILADVLLGPDPGDDACRRVDWSRLGAGFDHVEEQTPDRPLAGVRAGVAEGDLFEVTDERLRRQFAADLRGLEDAGAILVPVRLPDAETVMATLLAADLPASAGLHTETLLARGSLVDRRIRALLEFAHQIPAALVGRAHQVRRVILAAVAEAFRSAELDVLAAPGMVAPRIEHGQEDAVFRTAGGGSEGVLNAYVRPHALASVTGQPALVIPTGDPQAPGSLQLIGRPFADGRLLRIAEAAESRVGLLG